MAEFASVVDAVRGAVELQREMALRNDDIRSKRRIHFRIGINVGDIIIEADDIYGDGVNVAARLEALVDPGSICVSAIVTAGAGANCRDGVHNLRILEGGAIVF